MNIKKHNFNDIYKMKCHKNNLFCRLSTCRVTLEILKFVIKLILGRKNSNKIIDVTKRVNKKSRNRTPCCWEYRDTRLLLFSRVVVRTTGLNKVLMPEY